MLQAKLNKDVVIAFVPDSAYSLDAVNVAFYFKANQTQLRLLLALADLLNIRHLTDLQHIRSHGGNPWNELADTQLVG